MDSKGHGRERFCEDLELIAITEWAGRWREKERETAYNILLRRFGLPLPPLVVFESEYTVVKFDAFDEVS